MNRRLVDMLVWTLWASPLIFFAVSSASLPEHMASHFTEQGVADGFSSRSAYLWPLGLLTVGVPLLLGWMLPALFSLNTKGLSLPHSEHWLAPQRLASTLADLRNRFRWLAFFVCALFAFIHGQVAYANLLQPPYLTDSQAKAGVLVFLVITALWVLTFLLHYRRPR